MSSTGWIHKNTVIDRDEDTRRYFVGGFYGDGEPTFRTLAEVKAFIDAVQAAETLPENWQDFLAAKAGA